MLKQNSAKESESEKQTRENIKENGKMKPTKEDSNTNTVIEQPSLKPKTCKEENVCTLLDIGSYVIVKYDGELYPAKILNKEKNEWYCCAMRKSGVNHWKWPDSPDLLWYKDKDVVSKINEPKTINTRGVCVVPELEDLLK